jgi:hypothetical protein
MSGPGHNHTFLPHAVAACSISGTPASCHCHACQDLDTECLQPVEPALSGYSLVLQAEDQGGRLVNNAQVRGMRQVLPNGMPEADHCLCST